MTLFNIDESILSIDVKALYPKFSFDYAIFVPKKSQTKVLLSLFFLSSVLEKSDKITFLKYNGIKT